MQGQNCNLRDDLALHCGTLFAVLLALITTSCYLTVPQTGCYKRDSLDPEIEAAIDEFRASVPTLMREGDIPGCALALIDGDGILWTEGFGYADRKRREPVTPDTLFCLESVSKTWTATAVMLAVQDGLVDLDAPISTYLPDFTVNSRYEDNPENLMTLRHLLSHTSGLPLEASVGNLAETTGSFEEHVRSIDGTWLMYPVGQAFAYSNIGLDLAAYVLQVVSNVPFAQHMRQRLFDRLSLTDTVVGGEEYMRLSNRATGYTTGIAEAPYHSPKLGSAYVYSSVTDCARFAQLHLNNGVLEDQRFLSEPLVRAMHAPHAILSPPDVYYGLGVGIDKRVPEGASFRLGHTGGYIGFTSAVFWYPEYGIGVVALANRFPGSAAHQQLGLALSNRLIVDNLVEKRTGVRPPDYGECVGPWDRLSAHDPTPYEPSWSEHCGTYDFLISGIEFKWWASSLLPLSGSWPPQLEVHEDGGFLCITECELIEQVGRRHVHQPLQEQGPGLFFTASGLALDLEGEVPTWGNFRLRKR